MTEEGDNPTVSGVVQSTSMDSLNDELNPKTDKPQQELKSGNNIQHEIGGFKKFLTTSAQVIRLYWVPILISSIVCFVFNSDIAEISLARNQFALLFNAFAILLLFKLIKGENEGEVTTSLGAGMDNEIKSNEEDIDNFKREPAAKNDNKLKAEMTESLQSPGVTIHAKFTGISKLTFVEYVYSQPTEINGITWKTSLYKGFLYKGESLFYLYAENKNAVNWFCPVIAEFRLISPKSNTIVLREERELTFDAEDRSNCLQSISFKDLFDKEKGYVIDDSITFEVVIRPHPANHLKKLEWKMSCLIKENSKLSGDVQRILEKVESNSRDLKTLHEQTSLGFEKVRENLRNLLDRTNEMTIRARFTEISKLTEEAVFSHWTEFAGFSWRIKLEKSDGRLGIYLMSKKVDQIKWSCAVLADFQLLSQKDDSIVHHYEYKEPRVVDESLVGWGIRFTGITFEDLLKGDAVKDDSIIVAVVVRVFPTN